MPRFSTCARLCYIFRLAEQVYVAADLLFYYEEGNPAAFQVPDVFVVKGVPKHDWRIYKLWDDAILKLEI
jgi:hypothetical protein